MSNKTDKPEVTKPSGMPIRVQITAQEYREFKARVILAGRNVGEVLGELARTWVPPAPPQISE